MRKIAFLGGTFDPVHNGHLHIARTVSEYLKLDMFYFLPAYAPVHKAFHTITSDRHRMNMLKLAVEFYPTFEIEDMELASEGKLRYTIDTLKHLKQKYPEDEIYFVIGGDQAEVFSTWKSPKEITELVRVVSVMRRGCRPAKDFDIEILPMVYMDISSTEIREMIQKRISIQAFVPRKIENYIKENHLYEA